MSRTSEVDMDKLANNLLVFDQLLARATSTGSLRLEVHDVIDEKSSSVTKMAVQFDDLEAAIAAVRLDRDDGAIPMKAVTDDGVTVTLPIYDGAQKAEETPTHRTGVVLDRFIQLVKSDLGLLVILLFYTWFGALAFYYTEHERDEELRLKMGVERRLFAERIWNLTNHDHRLYHHHHHRHVQNHRHHHQLRADGVQFDIDDASNWTMTTGSPASEFNVDYLKIEQLLDEYALRKGIIQPNSKLPGWSYWGALIYCGTVVTTVAVQFVLNASIVGSCTGYGHIVPVTAAGRIITMIYAAFGIPLCLIVLASLGKLLTRAIKYLWSFVLLFYYTGSVRRVRHMVPLNRLRMSLIQRIRDGMRRRKLQRIASRRPQHQPTVDGDVETDVCIATNVVQAQAELRRLETFDKTHVVSYEVDDKFNLPPVVALAIAFTYMLLGVVIYRRWENWTILEAFYFVFISLSTVGFGDIVPEHPKFFLASSVYVVIGLALIAMVINVTMTSVNSTIEIAKDKVICVGRKIVDVAQMRTERMVQNQHNDLFKDFPNNLAIQGLVFRRFERRCSL